MSEIPMFPECPHCGTSPADNHTAEHCRNELGRRLRKAVQLDTSERATLVLALGCYVACMTDLGREPYEKVRAETMSLAAKLSGLT